MTPWLAFLAGCWFFFVLYEAPYQMWAYFDDDDWVEMGSALVTFSRRVLLGATALALGYSLAMLMGE